MFALHERLKADTFFVTDCALSSLLLMNNKLFPWVILVPRIENAREITDLSYSEQHLLMDEIDKISRVILKMFTPDKLNIAALGNQVPQLHVHIIARYSSDSAWPNPVWGAGCVTYDDPVAVIDNIRKFCRDQ